jgi:outer membrane protein TolC
MRHNNNFPSTKKESPMTTMTKKSDGSATSALPKLAVLVAALVLAGCTVTPKLATQEEVRDRVTADTALMYVNQVPISGPVTMEEAVARSLKYNLDYRLKKMESALSLGLADYASYDMLPNLLATAGYRARSNDSGGTSIGILDGVQSLRPSTSEERRHTLAGAEFSWNVLDFGVSYYRARQQADQYLVAEERRRKVVQNLVQDVRAAYWRALGAQRLAAQTKDILERANLALARSREAETQRVISPAQALTYQRALLDAISFLNQRRLDLEFANRELAALMNVEPGINFVVAEAVEAKLPAPPNDVRKLEDMALLQRPELREEDFKKRITADEARRQILGMLPGISFDAGVQYDSNNLLNSNSWSQGGVRISWNLLRLLALPTLKSTQEQQVRTDQARRMALSMAIMTQLRVGVERYRLAVEDFKLADTAAQVDKRLADYTRASVTAKLESELEAIRTQARAVLGNYQRANTYATAQIAFGRLYNTLGFDPLPDDFEGNALPQLTDRVRVHLKATEEDSLRMTSNLFGYAPAVSVRLVGVDDPVMNVRMKAQISELLTRNQVDIDTSNGIPMTFSLQRERKDGLEKANWSIVLQDAKGGRKGTAQQTSTMPDNARNSAYEASLVAAVTSKLPQMRSWLSELAQETKQ